jgi:hypothetical protein
MGRIARGFKKTRLGGNRVGRQQGWAATGLGGNKVGAYRLGLLAGACSCHRIASPYHAPSSSFPSCTTTAKPWWPSKERIGDAFVHTAFRTLEVKDLLLVVQDLDLTLPQQPLLLALELFCCNMGTGVSANMHRVRANMH